MLLQGEQALLALSGFSRNFRHQRSFPGFIPWSVGGESAWPWVTRPKSGPAPTSNNQSQVNPRQLQNEIDRLLSTSSKRRTEGKYFKRDRIIYNSLEVRQTVKIAREHRLFAHRGKEWRQLVKQLLQKPLPPPTKKRKQYTHILTHAYLTNLSISDKRKFWAAWITQIVPLKISIAQMQW